jgi:glycosyltransferase involved in cell wall biosynthesis
VIAASKNRARTQGRSTPLRGRDILCFSHDWSSDPLSKTHLIRVLSKDNRILWINAIANRKPEVSTHDASRVLKKLKSFSKPIFEAEPNIYVLNPLALPAYGNPLVRKFNQVFLLSQVRKAMRELDFESPVNMVFNPAAGLLAGRLGETEIIYYCVDDYTAFTGAAKGLREIEESLFQRSDFVVVSAKKLLDDKKKFNDSTYMIRHGTDWNHFRTATDPETPIPDDIAGLPKPVIGFHGLLADWVDFELIKETAEHFRNGSVVLIGKFGAGAEKKAKELGTVPNVHFLGRKPYTELPGYCKGFDVAINPFVINELTLAANPLKVREYLAAGLVTISTDIPEVRVLENCLVGRDNQEFIQQIENALRSSKSRKEVSDAIRHESWDAKVDELREIILRQALKNAG